MCGIAGILTDNAELDLATLLTKMRDALRHRGPDQEGQEVLPLPAGYRLGLAHTRLSILDTSEAGKQPMTDFASKSWIVYNGEIYNHQSLRKDLGGADFQSTGDTETLLKLWAENGETALSHLRGMFAFALLDGKRGKLWLVRDRLGVKPLYLAQPKPGTWLFASEVRALLASGQVERRLDRNAMRGYFTLGAVPSPRTLVAGVESLLPAEAVQFDLKPNGRPEMRRSRYWRPTLVAGVTPPASRDKAVERLRPILKEAIALRMLSDVPVGVFLSGGIDSSSIVASLVASGQNPHTLSVVFDEANYDESRFARLVAEKFGTQHHELLLRPGAVCSQFEPALSAYDQPSTDGLNMYFIGEATRAAGFTVALSGVGGDELFAGYPHFRSLARLQNPWVRTAAKAADLMLRLTSPHSARGRKLNALLEGKTPVERYLACRQLMNHRQTTRLLGETNDPVLSQTRAEELQSLAAGSDAINSHSVLELSVYLSDTLLRDTDQMSMAHSLEIREPLLDHLLVQAVLDLPGAWKLEPGKLGSQKGLLVDSLPVPLPVEATNRAKMGFVLPWTQWLKRELRPKIESILLDPVAKRIGLDLPTANSIWGEFLEGKSSQRPSDILALTTLIHWAARNEMRL